MKNAILKKNILKNIILTFGCVSCFLCFSGIFSGTSPAKAENFPKHVQKLVDNSIAIRQKTFKSEDKWAEEKIRLQEEYKNLKKEIENLTSVNEEFKKKVALRRASVTALEQKIAKVEQITNKITPFLEQTCDRLARFIDGDSPFLKNERNRRLVNLRNIIDDSDISISEKFRKLMETIFIEAQYGNTIEVYQENICINEKSSEEKDGERKNSDKKNTEKKDGETESIEGKNIEANVFRLGRIALFYQSLDRKTCGYYDTLSSSWKKFPKRYNREINAAMEMGSKIRPIDIVTLPIGKLVVK